MRKQVANEHTKLYQYLLRIRYAPDAASSMTMRGKHCKAPAVALVASALQGVRFLQQEQPASSTLHRLF